MQIPPMCMCAASFSSVRKLASVALSRSRWETAIASLAFWVARGAEPRSLVVAAKALWDEALGRRRDERLDSGETGLDARDHRVERIVRGLDAVVGAGQRAADL